MTLHIKIGLFASNNNRK